MTVAQTTMTRSAPRSGASLAPAMRRGAMLAVIAVVCVAAFLVTSNRATDLAIAGDGAALVRLLRFMAASKAVLAAAASAAVLWRLGSAISLPWFAAYALACGSMAAGPGLIWGMADVGLGALLLHGGLLATIMLVWRDPAVSTRLADIVAARRRQVAARTV